MDKPGWYAQGCQRGIWHRAEAVVEGPLSELEMDKPSWYAQGCQRGIWHRAEAVVKGTSRGADETQRRRPTSEEMSRVVGQRKQRGGRRMGPFLRRFHCNGCSGNGTSGMAEPKWTIEW